MVTSEKIEVGDEVLFYFDEDKTSWFSDDVPDEAMYKSKPTLGMVLDSEADLEYIKIQYYWMGMATTYHARPEMVRKARLQSWIGWFGTKVNPIGYQPAYVIIFGLSGVLLLKYYRVIKKS